MISTSGDGIFDGVYDNSVSALSRAAPASDANQVEKLLAHHSIRTADNRGWTALHWAAKNGEVDALGVMANGETP